MILNVLKNTLRNEAGEGGEAGGGAPAAAPAPAPAPTPAPAPAPAQEPAQEPAAAPQFEPTGDPTLDYVLGYIGEQGIDYDSPAFQAALSGDFAQLEIELLKKGAPGADKILALAQREWEREVQAQQQAADALAAELQQIAGGEQEWEEVVGWARDNATQEEKDAINGLLEQGGLAAKIAGEYLVNAFRGASGTSYEGRPAAQASAAEPAQAATGPLSRKDFAREAEKLYRQFGEGYQQTPDYQRLAARRAR